MLLMTEVSNLIRIESEFINAAGLQHMPPQMSSSNDGQLCISIYCNMAFATTELGRVWEKCKKEVDHPDFIGGLRAMSCNSLAKQHAVSSRVSSVDSIQRCPGNPAGISTGSGGMQTCA